MTDDSQLDEQLRRHYGALRDEDARRTPAFTAMLEAAQHDAAVRAAAEASPGAALRAPSVSHNRWRVRALAVIVPTLAAAGVLLMLRAGPSDADREFESLVTEWSRTASDMRSSPTDALLSLPGDEYLRGMPLIRGDRAPSRFRSPS